MASMSPPEPQWLVKGLDGSTNPKTPGGWKAFWASDNARLEEAYKNGAEELLVYGRKYLVNIKERTMRSLYWEEIPKCRPVIRGTYFVRSGDGWLPYSEEDASALEDFRSRATEQLSEEGSEEVEFSLGDATNKVVIRKKPEGDKKAAEKEGETSRSIAGPELELCQRSAKPTSILDNLLKTSQDVHRGTPAPGSWAGASCSDEDKPQEAKVPDHLVFVVHGVGESMWSKATNPSASLRQCCEDMRKLSVQFRKFQKESSRVGLKRGGSAKEGAKKPAGGTDEGTGDGEEDEDADDVGFVEFLPVEWHEQLHGTESVEEGIIRDISLPSLPAFREFAGQAVMDVMYYLTPDIQKNMLTTVASELNRMWEVFQKLTPDFKGKVSIVGHSLGSIISHDVLCAQPSGRIRTGAFAHELEIPILNFEPEVLVACGSPIGTFLTLRAGWTQQNDLFKFNTTKRFYNIFHPADPVAYRLEPLVDRRLKDLEPERVPHMGGDRIHIKVQKMNRTVTTVMNNLSRTSTEGWQLIGKTWANTMKSVAGEVPALEKPVPEEQVDDARHKLTERIDWALQETAFEGMHPWAAAIFAHGCYFQSQDLVMFLINAMEHEPLTELPQAV